MLIHFTQVIHAANGINVLPTNLLYELAQQSKALRDLRGSWLDQWDFDIAPRFDEML